MAALKYKRNPARKGNSLKGAEWLQLKALLCWSLFWQNITKGDAIA